MSENKGGILNTLGSFIPGYRGYKEKEARRDTDRILREAIVKRLGDRRSAVDRLVGDFSSKMQFDHLERLELIKRRLEKITDLIRHAPAGYSGFFDTVQVENADLDKLYRHDLDVRDKVELVTTHLGALGGAKDVGGACEVTLTALQDLEETVRHRDQAITEIK